MAFKNFILKISLAVVMLAASSASYAANPWRDCGIGAGIFGKTAWAAVTSNVTWDLGTTAFTSATWSPSTCSNGVVDAAKFIDSSYEKISEETAAGQGEHLTAILNIFQCNALSQPIAIRQMRSEMGAVVASPNYIDQTHMDKALQLFNIIDSAVKNSCPA